MSSMNEDLGPEWQRLGKIGGGAHGSVHLYRHNKTLQQFAVKFIDRGESITEHTVREVSNHSQLNHPNIIRFKEVILTPNKLAVVMEYCPGGDLFSYVQKSAGRRLPENIARYFFQQVVGGLAYMHSMGTSHRDLKLENILLEGNPPRLKLCDFGYSKSERFDSAANSKVGTAAYVAPEVLMHPKNTSYNAMAVDVWSSGVILHTLLTGMYPFCDPKQPNNEQSIMRCLVECARGQAHYSPPASASPPCQHLLQRIFQIDPPRRIQIWEMLELEWFKQNLSAEFHQGMGAYEGGPGAVPQQDREEAARLVQEARTIVTTPPNVGYLSQLTTNNSMDHEAFGEQATREAMYAPVLRDTQSGLSDPALSFESLFSSEFPAM